jgi:hypothetical protein
VAKPHFSTQPAADETAAEKAVAVKPFGANQPRVKPGRQSQVSEIDDADDESDSEDMAELNGQKFRLDGPEELRGMSKRERRKLRKAMKDRDQAAA